MMARSVESNARHALTYALDGEWLEAQLQLEPLDVEELDTLIDVLSQLQDLADEIARRIESMQP